MTPSVTIAILAAGAASRFGGGKLDADLSGKRLGHYAVEAANRLGLSRPIVIVREPASEFAREAEAGGQADLAINPLADTGLSSSIALAARCASESGSDRLLLILADMPFISLPTLTRLLSTTTDDEPACVHYPDGRRGIPACFPASWFERLQELSGDKGARGLFTAQNSAALADIAARELADIDTMDDLRGL